MWPETILFVVFSSALMVLLGKYINSSRTVRLHVNRKPSFRPRVSVIIPTWNEERVIEGTVRRIFEGFYGDVEVVVVDDRSTDRTLEILEKLKGEYPDLRVTVKAGPRGKAQSINEAMRLAKGEVILLVDADARLPKEYISTHVSCFSSDDIRMIFTDFEAYNYDPGNIVHEYQEIYFDLVKDVVYSNIFVKMMFMGSGVFFRREIMEKVLPIDPKTLVDDFSIAMKLSKLGVREYFSTYPKIGIQYVNTFKELWRQHMRWYYGGFREIIKWMKRGDVRSFGLYVFSLLFFFSPITLVVLSIVFSPKFLLVLMLLWIFVHSSFFLSQLFERDRKVSIFKALYLPLFVIAFEVSVLVPALLKAHFKDEAVWYKVERDEA